MEEIKGLEDEKQQLLDHIEELNNLLQSKEQQINQQNQIIDSYKLQLTLLENKLQEYTPLEQLLRDTRHRNNVLVAEIERLNKLVSQQATEASDYKQKLGRYDVGLAEYKQFELSHRDMVNRATKLADEVERLKSLLFAKHEELLQCQNELKMTQEELEIEREKNAALQARLDEFEAETANEKALRKILILKTENLRLNKIIEQQNNKLEEQSTLLDAINEKYNNQLRLTDDLRSAAELAEKKQKQAESELLQAQKEIEELKLKLKNLQDQMVANANKTNQELQDQIAKLQEMLNNSQANLRDTEEKLKDALNRLRDAEQRIAQLERQVRELDQMLQMNQAQAVKAVVQPVPQQPIIQSTYRNDNYEKQIAALQNELNALRNAKPFDDRLLRRQIQDQLCIIALFSAEIEALRQRVR